jgi:molecular chaperone GrpE
VTADTELQDVHTRLDELLDLFRRRLLDDRDKRRLIDDAFERARSAEAGPFREVLHPFVVGTALVVDRLDGYRGDDPGFAASIRDELLDVLQRHGVEQVEASGPVDPRCHEVMEVLEVPDPGLEACGPAVHQVLRRGYRHGDWVFRAARVVAVRSGPAAG